MFAEVYVCPDCYEVAASFGKRLDQELRNLQVMAKEAIRLALIDGRLHLPEGQPATELSKSAVLRAIVEMEEARGG